MTLTIGAIYIPIILTIVMAIIMMRPCRSHSLFGSALEPLFRLFWLFPILITWLIYFMVLAFSK